VRIAFFTTMKGTPWGGSEELWCAAASRALDAGHELMVSAWEWPDGQPKLTPIRARTAVWAPRPRRVNRLRRLFTPAWARQLAAFDPEVVCVSQGGAYECAGHRSMAALFKWLARNDAALVNLIQYNAEFASLGDAAAVRSRWLYQRARVNAFVAQANADEAGRRLGIAVPRVRVVRNPVNLTDTAPLPWPAGEGARFACVARVDAKTKGQDLLLRAFAAPAWRDRPWSLDLYGHGPDEAKFAAMAKDLGVADRVAFRGHVSDVRAVWADHHCLAMPSRAEGTPLAMVEAMTLGRPCVVCHIGGCAEFVRDGVEGFIAPRPMLEDVAAALERAWAVRDRWPQLGQAGRARAIELLGPDPAKDFLDVLVSAGQARVTAPAP